MGDTAQLGYLALAKQAAKGTPNTADLAAQQLLHNSHTLGLAVEVNDPDPEIGGSREPALGSATFGGAKVTGDLDAKLRFHLLPFFLLGAGYVESGAPVEQTTGSGAWRHRFIPGTASYLTVETSWGLNRLVRTLSDLLVDSLELSIDAEGEGALSASFLGLSEQVKTTGPSAVSTSANDGKAIWYQSAVILGGLSTYRCKAMSLKIENDLSDDEYLIGSRNLGEMTPGQRSVVLGMTLNLGANDPDVTALYRAAAYGNPTATSPGAAEPFQTTGAVTFGSAKLIGTSTTERYRAVATLPGLVLKPFALEQSGADALDVAVEARQYGAGYTIDVYNSRATAY